MSIGFHVSKTSFGGSMLDALEAGARLSAKYGFDPLAQIFVIGPHTYEKIDITGIEDHTKKYPVVIHGAYIDHPWGGSPQAIGNIRRELKISAKIRARGVIIHLSAAAAGPNFGAILSKLTADIPATTLWLEINAAKPSQNTYETPQKISDLFDRVGRADTHNVTVGLCIDTAHLFSCGLSFREYSAAQSWLSKLPKIPVMFHLNDSAADLGSGRDVHQVLGRGNIWQGIDVEDSGIMAVLEWARAHESMIILERNLTDLRADLKLIHDLRFF